MKLIKYILITIRSSIKSRFGLIKSPLILFVFFLTACDDFVEVDLPNNLLNTQLVFEDVATVNAALKGLYAEMRDGSLNSLSSSLGLYADELDNFGTRTSLFEHTIQESDGRVLSWWSHGFNLIYSANNILEGLENTTSLTLEDQNQFKGEALFVRGYVYALLVQLFGPVPYITTTDYIANSRVSRTPVDQVYSKIIEDLEAASNLLGDDISGERIRPYKAVAEALLARVYLYTGDHQEAESMASNVIDAFVLEPDLNKVFLKNTSSTIWQFIPGVEGENTRDAELFILYGQSTGFVLNESFVLNEFESGDLRLSWVDSTTINAIRYYYPFKYKERTRTFETIGNEDIPTSFEYPIVFRLAEQYLIRAEARAQLGNNISGAQNDLNIIRNRAGLSNTMAASTGDLLTAIHQERRSELFTERGQRWFDLKRSGTAAEVLAPIKPNWRDSDILFPVPQAEILLNPNLLPQNDGYN